MAAAATGASLYVVAYDIAVDKRRTKVHRVLCGFGQWTQYSLFECWLTRRQVVELRAKLAEVLDARVDSVRLYGLCGGCAGKVETIGGAPPQEPLVFLA
ncbi:MAG: CRISPR-associated endonuclease Cas2 [Chloroflexaceae bacterium]|nr:CRISPR-associated endonuclease Cas2 [Chloroflexaceae bacterium]